MLVRKTGSHVSNLLLSMLVGVSSTGNLRCGVVSPRFAVRTNHNMYGEGRTKQETGGVRRAMQGTVKHQKSINVWGCFSWNGVGDLHRLKGTLNGPEYQKNFDSSYGSSSQSIKS